MGAVFFVGFAIIGIILAGLFIIGTVFLIFGTVQKKNSKYAGKKPPSFYIARGRNYLIPPIGAAIYLAWFFGDGAYAHVTDRWRSGRFNTDSRVSEEAIEGLLTSADAGDRDYFEKMFAPKLRERSDFQRLVDAFFESYPNGLSFCELDGSYGSNRALYTCFLDEEWYYIELEFRYGRWYTPDDIGVTFFCIENLEANALRRDYVERDFLTCEIADESEVDARLINGRGRVFTPTPDRSITVEQMKIYLEKYNDLDDLAGRIGEPNVSKKHTNSTSSGYYYELVPEDGEPRYAYIDADPYSGEIYYSYICSDVDRITDIMD